MTTHELAHLILALIRRADAQVDVSYWRRRALEVIEELCKEQLVEPDPDLYNEIKKMYEIRKR